MEVPRAVRSIIAIWMSVALALALPVASSAKGVFGTLRAKGSAWVAAGEGEWWPVASTRPFVLGDRLRTGTDGYLLAELGDAGAIGLFSGAEVTTVASEPVIDVQSGKVAFRLSAASPVRLTALDAGIVSDAVPAAGYVEYGDDGVPVVVTEQGRVSVRLGDTRRTLESGEQLVLKAGEYPEEAIEPAESIEDIESKKAAEAPAEGDQPRRKFLGLGGWGWTGIAVVAAAVGGGVAAAGGGGGGGDDSNGSPDGE